MRRSSQNKNRRRKIKADLASAVKELPEVLERLILGFLPARALLALSEPIFVDSKKQRAATYIVGDSIYSNHAEAFNYFFCFPTTQGVFFAAHYSALDLCDIYSDELDEYGISTEPEKYNWLEDLNSEAGADVAHLNAMELEELVDDKIPIEKFRECKRQIFENPVKFILGKKRNVFCVKLGSLPLFQQFESFGSWNIKSMRWDILANIPDRHLAPWDVQENVKQALSDPSFPFRRKWELEEKCRMVFEFD